MNPSEISPETLFVCGPISDPYDTVAAAQEITMREECLNQLGLETFNPSRIFMDLKIEGVKMDRLLNYQISCLAMCEKVITLLEWERCEVAQKIVAIARIMNKPIIPYSNFILKNTKS